MRTRVFACLTLATLALAQSPVAFDAADIRESPKVRNAFMTGPYVRAGAYEIRNATMLDLISKAYGLDGDNIQGGPSWLDWDRFDITALAPPKTKSDALRAMLKALLADRFKLVLHNDTRPMPAYALTTGKRTQLKQSEVSTDGESKETGCRFSQGPRAEGQALPTFTYACHNVTMAGLADGIKTMPFSDRYLNSLPIVDRTELKGNWDLTIKFTPPPRPGVESEVVTIQDAFEKQAGLVLTPVKVPMPVVLVDSVNRTPTPNSPEVTEKLKTFTQPTEFEVATIRPTDPDVQGIRFNVDPGGRVTAQGVTLQLIMQQVWNFAPDMIIGAPKWLAEDRYTIVAKAPEAAMVSDQPGGPQNGPPIDFQTAMRMFKSLLIERFQIVTHTEERTMSAYTLMPGKPKMKAADPNSRTQFKEGPAPDAKNDPRNRTPILARLVTVQNMTMAQFAEKLQDIAPGYIHSPVLDSTGLKGSFDFTLSFSPAGAAGGGGGRGGDGVRGGGGAGAPGGGGDTASDPNGAITLPEAIDRQLGLKLEQQKRPVTVLVIDKIERKPTEN